MPDLKMSREFDKTLLDIAELIDGLFYMEGLEVVSIDINILDKDDYPRVFQLEKRRKSNMKFLVDENMVVLTASSSDYNINGKKGTSYKLGVQVGQEIDTLPCVKEIFEAFQGGSIPPYQKLPVVLEVDTKYKRVMVMEVAGFN